MKRMITASLACVALGAGTGAAFTASSASAGGPANGNIVQVAASNPQFSTLVSLVKEAGLVGALSGSSKLTVFAPTNGAFAAVPTATLNKLKHNRALLAKVLEYHVVKGEVLAAQVVKLHSAKTLEGASVRISVKGGSVYVNNAKVIKTNVKASNGVIHVIDHVLLPPGA